MRKILIVGGVAGGLPLLQDRRLNEQDKIIILDWKLLDFTYIK